MFAGPETENQPFSLANLFLCDTSLSSSNPFSKNKSAQDQRRNREKKKPQFTVDDFHLDVGFLPDGDVKSVEILNDRIPYRVKDFWKVIRTKKDMISPVYDDTHLPPMDMRLWHTLTFITDSCSFYLYVEVERLPPSMGNIEIVEQRRLMSLSNGAFERQIEVVLNSETSSKEFLANLRLINRRSSRFMEDMKVCFEKKIVNLVVPLVCIENDELALEALTFCCLAARCGESFVSILIDCGIIEVLRHHLNTYIGPLIQNSSSNSSVYSYSGLPGIPDNFCGSMGYITHRRRLVIIIMSTIMGGGAVEGRGRGVGDVVVE